MAEIEAYCMWLIAKTENGKVTYWSEDDEGWREDDQAATQYSQHMDYVERTLAGLRAERPHARIRPVRITVKIEDLPALEEGATKPLKDSR